MNISSNSVLVQPLLFTKEDVECCLLSEVTPKELEFARLWDVLCSFLPDSIFEENKPKTGRPGFSWINLLAVSVIKAFFNHRTMTNTLDFIRGNSNIRMITGITRVPSAATVSRKMADLDKELKTPELLARIVEEFHSEGNCLVCNLSQDSTIVEAREKPFKEEKQKEAPSKRGRKKKGSLEEQEYLERKETEKTLKELTENGNIDEYMATLNGKCAKTGKKNSKGDVQYKIGYKIHLAVDDWGVPVAYLITGANVHDSKVAIPLLRVANENCTFLYALMDAGYGCESIENYVYSIGKVPVIDFKANRNGEKREKDPAKKIRYNARTTVERTNNEVKSNFLPNVLYGRGPRAKFELALSILLTAISKIMNILAKKVVISEVA